MSNSPERTGPAGTYESGETVSLAIAEATVFHQGDRLTVVVDDIYITVPASAVIKRVTPSRGQPQPGDIWTDAAGTEWFATDRPGTRGLMFQPANGMAESWPNVNDATGPLHLTYRPVPAAAPAEPAAPVTISDETLRQASQLDREHKHPGDWRSCFCTITPDELAAESAPAVPVAVSPERVAEICVELNRLNLEGTADAETVYIWNLPDLDKVTQRSELNEAFAFTLHGGIAIEFSSAHGWQQVTR